MPPVGDRKTVISDLAKKESREVLGEFFKGIGYDIEEYSEVRRLQEDLRWANKRREREITTSASWSKIVLAIVTAIVGAVIAIVGQTLRDWWQSIGGPR